MRTEVDHSLLQYESFERDYMWVDGHLFMPWFLENWHRYSWEEESLPKAWATAWTRGSQNRAYDPEMEEAMIDLLIEMDLDGLPTEEIMNEEERHKVASLNYPVELFRGINLQQKEDLDLEWPGCCWTLRQEKAEWFAKRSGTAHALLKLKVASPYQIWACFLQRNEEEIVLDCRSHASPDVIWL